MGRTARGRAPTVAAVCSRSRLTAWTGCSDTRRPWRNFVDARRDQRECEAAVARSRCAASSPSVGSLNAGWRAARSIRAASTWAMYPPNKPAAAFNCRSCCVSPTERAFSKCPVWRRPFGPLPLGKTEASTSLHVMGNVRHSRPWIRAMPSSATASLPHCAAHVAVARSDRHRDKRRKMGMVGEQGSSAAIQSPRPGSPAGPDLCTHHLAMPAITGTVPRALPPASSSALSREPCGSRTSSPSSGAHGEPSSQPRSRWP